MKAQLNTCSPLEILHVCNELIAAFCGNQIQRRKSRDPLRFEIEKKMYVMPNAKKPDLAKLKIEAYAKQMSPFSVKSIQMKRGRERRPRVRAKVLIYVNNPHRRTRMEMIEKRIFAIGTPLARNSIP